MDKCIFCEIASKSIPSYIFFEDEISLAFLDINPRSKAMSILIPKKHYVNFDEDLETTLKLFENAVKISKAIKDVLNVKDVYIASYKMQVNHFHIKIFPIDDEIPIIESKPIIVTEAQLNEWHEKLKSIKIEIKKEEKKESLEEEKEKIRGIIEKWKYKYLP